jgi:hypothetical protein
MPLIRRPPVEFRRKFPGELGDRWSGTCIRVADRYRSFLSINLSIYLSIYLSLIVYRIYVYL